MKCEEPSPRRKLMSDPVKDIFSLTIYPKTIDVRDELNPTVCYAPCLSLM